MEKSGKNPEIGFLEKILLLALNDKGWFGNSEHSLKFGLTGAILFELIFCGRLELKEQTVQVKNQKSTDDEALDKILNFIKSGKKNRNLQSWIQRIVYKKLLLRKMILKGLMDKKIIKKEEFSLFYILYQFKYPLLDHDIKKSIRDDIYDKVISGGKLTDHDIMLIAVMDSCKMIRKNFKKYNNYSGFRHKIKEITTFKEMDNQMHQIIKSIYVGIKSAIMRSNVTIHA